VKTAPAIALVTIFLGIGVVACTPNVYGDLPSPPVPSQSAATTQSCASSGGGGKAVQGVDPSAFTVCKGTKGTSGRCIPSSALGPESDKFEQASCASGQSCLPDQLVKEGTSIQLQKCTGVLNSEGRCFWPLAKDIIANYDILKGSSQGCSDGMICAPCVNPLTQQETGICNIGGAAGGGGDGGACGGTPDSSRGDGGAPAPAAGKCPQVDPIIDVSSFSVEDCGADMLCVDANIVPPAEAAQLTQLKSCAKGKCVPKKSVERAGNYVPKSCRSTGDSEGRCLNVGIPKIAEQSSLLPTADCDADERCAPCFDPRSGEDTGACHSASCDKPKEPKKVFASCCGSAGRCVPTDVVSGNASSLLTNDSCSGDTPLCAPAELVGVAQPQRCSAALGLISGICVSGCTLVIGDLVQGDCPDGDMCAPCKALPPGSCN
jgi:hypothetical protein